MKMEYCKKCMMPTTRPRIRFNEEGVCNACLWAEEKKTFDWSPRWQELEQLCDKYRTRNKNKFDVIVPYSGGKDGGYIAWTLKNKLHMHPLVVTIRPPMEDPVGEQNIKNFLEKGYDHIMITPNKRVGEVIDKENFINKGIPMHAHMIAIQTEYGGCSKLKNSTTYNIEDSISIYLSGVDPKKYSKEFTSKELYWYTFPEKEELMELKPEIAHWSYFEDFDNYSHYLLAKRELGLVEKNERNTGTYENFSTTDTYIVWLYYYLMYLKFGFGRTSHLASVDIRKGAITRKQGIELVKMYDGEFPEQYVPYYLDYYHMTRKEFDAVLDKWANKELFEKKNGKWMPVFEIH